MANPAPAPYPFKALGYIAVTTAGTPVQVQSTSQNVKQAVISAFKAKGTPNSGNNVYVLDSASNVLFTIPKGTSLTINANQHGITQFFDISTLWLDVDTSGDAALVTIQQ